VLPQANRRAKTRSLVVVTAIGIASCSGHSNDTTLYVANPTSVALRAAGWTVHPGPGMNPIAGGHQIAWLDITSPHGDALSLQFLTNGDHAKRELAAATKQSRTVHGATIGDVLVFERPDGATPVPPPLLDQLRQLLRQH
jgi:hypothetical protein